MQLGINDSLHDWEHYLYILEDHWAYINLWQQIYRMSYLYKVVIMTRKTENKKCEVMKLTWNND